MTVMLFDGAAIVWAITFVTQAKSTSQWAFAAVGFVIGLLGAVLMAAGELILGQNLVTFNDPTRLGWILITAVITACVTHVTLIYLYHFADPMVKNRIEIQQKIASKIEQAHVDARNLLDRETSQLTAGIRDSVIEAAKQLLEGEIGIHVKERNKRAVDNSKLTGEPPILTGVARDIPYHPVAASPASARQPVHKWEPNKKQQRPQQKHQPRPSGVSMPTYGNNGRGSAEHDAFAAASFAPDAVKEAERSSPPSRPDSPKS
jgi:hypothetical protein